MIDHQILDAYTRIRQSLALPALSACRLHLAPHALPAVPVSADQWQDWLSATIQKFGPTAGWLAGRTRPPIAFVNEPLPQRGGDDWLYGEVCKEGASLHFRQDGKGGWVATELHETDADAEAMDCLVQVVTLQPTTKAPGPLRYRTFWREDELTGMRRFAFRFDGFEAGKS